MSAKDIDPVEEVFLAAIAREPSERAAYIKAACADEALVRQVQALVYAYEENGTLPRPAMSRTQHGRGGMIGSSRFSASLAMRA